MPHNTHKAAEHASYGPGKKQQETPAGERVEPPAKGTQAASAHDAFWEVVSLMPESTHRLMWVMSDRALPRSFVTTEGFDVHSFKLVKADGHSVFVKLHWKPRLGTVSLVWDEAVKISGTDPDFRRRDLWQRIEAGIYPQWDLGIEVIPKDKAEHHPLLEQAYGS